MNTYDMWVYNGQHDIYIERYYAKTPEDAIELAKADHGYLDCKWEAILVTKYVQI